MCGISGMMSSGREAPAQGPVDAMGAALAHRGPDGMRAYRAGDVAMTHNRLAIVDLQTGDQPLFEPDGAALVANGEIYNDPELRAALGLRGAALPLSPRRRRLRRRAARHVGDRAARPARRPAAAVARPVRDQAALLRRAARRRRLRL